MRKLSLIASTALGIVVGAVLFNAPSALADWPVIDVTSIAKEIGIENVLQTISSTMNTVRDSINSLLGANGPIASILGPTAYGTVNDLLREGFTQNANYSKAQISAQEQIADGSNTVMSQFQRQLRDREIVDEQTPTASACSSLDGGVGASAAGIQAYDVAATISAITDQRGQAGPNTPAYYGQGQAAQAIADNHYKFYCDANEAAAGLCTVQQTPDADQEQLSLYGSGVYTSQQAINAAKDYMINLTQPIVPAALRGDQLASVAGQDAAARRRSYNARMSLAHGVLADQIGMQTPSVPLTQAEQQYLQERNLPAETSGSWLQVMQIEAERRWGDVTWNANLEAMPPASVVREIAQELALTNFLLFQQFKQQLYTNSLSAAHLAEVTNKNFVPTVRMPAPSLAGN